jgi:hypothetical protein
LPQAAQFCAVPSVVSQPAAAVQSAKPELQVPIVHVPVPHEALAFKYEQGVLQSPQSVSVRMLRSQPLSRMPSQLFQPALQVGEQPVVGLHAVMPFGFVHTSLHERQCAGVPSWVSQAGAPVTHSANPGMQVIGAHVPLPQVSTASQPEPHAPQSVSVQTDVSQPFAGFPSQLSQPVLHVYPQPFVPLQLTGPWAFEQLLPHERQFVSVPSGVSQPVAGFMSQLPKLPTHALSTHDPLEQVSFAFTRSQSTSQSPQSLSERMLRSQPLPRSPSQLFHPMSQTGVQPDAVHDVEP